MSYIIRYLAAMTPYMIATIPIFAFFRFIVYHKTKKLNLRREVILLIFTVFLVGLASQTVIPKFDFTDGIKIIGSGTGEINLIPFKVIPETYREVVINGRINYFIINFLGNIIMFMPIGSFIPALWNIKSRNVILIGAGISLFIEITQLLLPRGTDIDDLILNTLGTALGLIVYKLISKKHSNFFTKL